MIVGCSQDETVSRSGDTGRAISFDTYVGRNAATRSAELNKEGLQGLTPGFGVFAYLTSGDFSGFYSEPQIMNNVSVTYDDENSVWRYSGRPKYWPKSEYEKISFFAYAPYSDPSGLGTYAVGMENNIPVISGLENGTDYLATDGIMDQTASTNGGKVDMPFRHMMARVGCSVKTGRGVTNSDIQVQSVKLSFASLFATTAELTWNAISRKAQIAITGRADATSEYRFEWQNFNATSVAVNNPNDGYLFFIPQTYAANENTYIFVDYTVKGEQKTAKRELEAGEFKGGHAYRFNITLNVSAIEFTVEQDVEGWTEMESKEVTIN